MPLDHVSCTLVPQTDDTPGDTFSSSELPTGNVSFKPNLGGGQSSYDDKSKVKQQDAGGEAGTGASLPVPGFSQRAQTGLRMQ